MKNLIPNFIIEQFELGNQSGTFEAGGLFVDISGFTKTTEALMEHGQEGAEMLADVMQAVFEPLVESVYAQGGFITGFAGDAFTALFPAQAGSQPQTDQRLERALAAALRIQQYMAAHPIQSTPVGSFSFGVKLGVAHGHVTWGILQPTALEGTASNAFGRGSAASASYYFSGAAVDDCAGAEHYANSGDLILTSSVYEAIGSLVTVEAVEDHFRVMAAPGSLPAPQAIHLPPSDPHKVAAFVEPAIIKQKALGEFRNVLTVFIQLDHIDEVSELNRFVQAIFTLQEQYGGHLNAIDFGDKGCNMLLFWGMPTSFENDIERALNFVLALSSMTSITFRAGITYRLMYAGLVGAPLRRDYSCYGRGVNLAARHMIAAPWGGLWLDEEVSKRADGLFALSFEGHFKFKGFAQKLPVHGLVGRKEAIESHYIGQMVGRQAELTRLVDFLQPIFEGHFAGLMLIEGEAGIGKSRLVHVLQESKALKKGDMTPRWFLCQSDQILRQSLNPFRYWLRRYFSRPSHDHRLGAQGEANQKQRFELILADLIAVSPDPALQEELERTRSLLGALVDLQWADSLYEQLEPELRFNNTLEALKTLIKAESLRQPVIIQLEDAHWLDSDSVQVIQHLTRNLDDYPIAIIATARPQERGRVGEGESGSVAVGAIPGGCPGRGGEGESGSPSTSGTGGEVAPASLLSAAKDLAEVAPPGVPASARSGTSSSGQAAAIFGDEVNCEEMILTALSAADLGELALEVLGASAAPPLVDLLAKGADGNPFFAEQILLYLRDEGRLCKSEAGFIPTATEAPLPTDVRALLIARLDRLTQEVKAIVQTAAVLGREFEVRLLAQMWRDPSLINQVSSAEEAAIWSALNQLRYLFKHALLRDTAYDMQLRAQQRQLHELAAHAIETLYAADLTPHYGQLTYHYGQAQNEAQERHYAKLAGEYAAAQYANDEAIRYFSRTLELTPESYLEARYDLLLAREAVYDWQGKRDAQTQDLDALATLAFTLKDEQKQASVSLRQTNYADRTGNLSKALSIVPQAIKYAALAQNPTLEAEGYYIWGLTLRRTGNYEDAQQRLKQALILARANHQQKVEADSLQQLAVISFYLGNYVTASEYSQQALAIYRATSEHKGEATSLMMLGTLHTHRGAYLAGQKRYNQALNVYQMIGYRIGETLISGNLGGNFADVGDYELARDYQKQALTISQEIGDSEGVSFAFCNLTLIHYNLGNYEMAHRTSEQALTIHRKIGDRRSEAYTLTYLGHTLADSGQWESAKDAYQKAIKIRRELEAEKLVIDNLAGLARVAMSEGNISQALSYVEEILAWIEINGVEGIEYPLQVYLTCYQVLQASADDETEVGQLAARAETILVTAHTLLQEQAAKIKDEALRRKFLENVSFNRQIQTIWEAKNPISTANQE
ncbi:MAG: tetratricopeptide repeat protein [Ardenticatenaceae bacterium]